MKSIIGSSDNSSDAILAFLKLESLVKLVLNDGYGNSSHLDALKVLEGVMNECASE